jgi:hypothetical protein
VRARSMPAVRKSFAALVLVAALIAAFVVGVTPAAAAPGPTLTAGHTLTSGLELLSPNGSYKGVVQGDGNFVIYGPSGVAFQTHTKGATAKLSMQTDGNLVLYAGGRAVWSTGTQGIDRSGAFVTMQSDGNLVLYNSGHALWSSKTGRLAQPPSIPGTSIGTALQGGVTLAVGQKIVSPSSYYVATMQADGNFVIYGPSGAIYSTRTSGASPRLVMQGDGNLVLYAGGGVRFNTGTAGTVPHATMQDDGNFVVYGSGRALWSSKTGRLPHSPLGSIAGTITDPTGARLQDVEVDLWTVTDGQLGDEPVDTVDTDANGMYQINNVRPSTAGYLVCFDPFAAIGGPTTTGWVAQCYNSKPFDGVDVPAGATKVAVTAGSVHIINPVLAIGGAISGTVTSQSTPGQPVQGELVLSVGSDLTFGGIDITATNGTYLVKGLPAASDYLVCFIGPSASASNECYNNVPWSEDVDPNTLVGTTRIAVTAGHTTSGIDAAL